MQGSVIFEMVPASYGVRQVPDGLMVNRTESFRQIEWRELSSTAVGPEQSQEEAVCSQQLPPRLSGQRGLLSWVVCTYVLARSRTILNRAKFL